MSFPTCQEIKKIAAGCGYFERRDEVSSTIFLQKRDNNKYPTLINIFYTTRGIMTMLSHPKSGYNQLWRSTAYDSIETLEAILINPRSHTGKGYRTADKAVRGCTKCGMQKERGDFSKNQWRKGPDQSKCLECVQQQDQGHNNDVRDVLVGSTNSNGGEVESSSSGPTTSHSLPILFLGARDFFVDSCGDVMKKESAILSEQELIQNPSKAQITDISRKYRGVVTTDDWFDVDDEYQPLANSILRTLKEMYDAGGSVVVAVTMGIFSVPGQLTRLFEFNSSSSSSWRLSSYTKKTITTTPIGNEILGRISPTYTKANFVQAPEEECLFVEYINTGDYENDSDCDDGPPIPDKDSPVVTHRGANGGTLSYFGFVNDMDVPYGDIMLNLMNLSTLNTGSVITSRRQTGVASLKNNDDRDIEIDRTCIECDAEGCRTSAPSILCRSCKMAFYCSPSCQSRHHLAHIDECRVGATMRDRAATYKEPSEQDRRGIATAALLAGRRDFAGVLLQAEYWQFEGNWEGAMECYKSIFDDCMSRSPSEQRQLMMGITRCFYELGNYDIAIDMGKGTIEMNRHFPGIHKYVALAQKAKGDYAGSKATMTRAVLYETPWDDDNIKANKALLREIQA